MSETWTKGQHRRVWAKGVYYLDENGNQAYMDTATVTFELLDRSGTVVIAAVTLQYLPGSNGDYWAVILVNVPEGQYTARYTETSVNGNRPRCYDVTVEEC